MEKLKVYSNVSAMGGWWFVASANKTINARYLWKDLKLHPVAFGYAPDGYYATKAEAERYLRAYEVSQMKFIVRQCRHWPERGWYIITDTGAGYRKEQFVWLDLELHNTTGWGAINHYGYSPSGTAPGYYCNQAQAEHFLKQFKEKHNMAQDNLEINVKLNGVNTPLYEISEQTLLNLREASKPKPVPVFQVCNSPWGPRLTFKVTKKIADCKGQYVMLDAGGGKCNCRKDAHQMLNDPLYNGIRELRLDEV